MRRMVKWWLVLLALGAALFIALEMWRGAEESIWAGAPRRIELSCQSSDKRMVLAVVLLDAQGDVVCSGVSLSSRWVLTAAHCVVGGGRARRAQSVHAPRSVPLAALYVHPHFTFRAPSRWAARRVTTLAHDVGMVQTREPLEPRPPELSPRQHSRIAPHRHFYALGYHTLNDLVGRKLVMVGYSQRAWSREPWGAEAAAELTLSAYTGEVCGARGPWVTAAPEPRDTPDGPGSPHRLGAPGGQWRGCVCARAQRPLCRGESGAGLFVGNQLVAIASLGPLNCSQPALSVFTIISPYMRSIRKTIARRGVVPYKERDHTYVDLRSDHTTTLHPYVKAVRSKATSDEALEDNLVEYRQWDTGPSGAGVLAGAAGGGRHTTPRDNKISTENQSQRAAEDTSNISVPTKT